MSDIVTKSKTFFLILGAALIVAGLALVAAQAPAILQQWTLRALLLPGPAALLAVLALLGLAIVPRHLRGRVVLLVVLGTLIALTSVAATAAALLMLTAAAAVGTLVVPLDHRKSLAGLAATTMVGLAILLGFFSLLLPFPVNRPSTYALIMMIAIAPRGRELWGCLREILSSPNHVEREGTLEHWTRFLATTASIAAVAGSLYPIIMADDVAYHLRLASQLFHHARYYFDVKYYIWATGPFASDFAYAIDYVVSGGDDKVHTILRSFYTLTILILTWDLVQQTASRTFSWLALAILASAPIVHYLNHSMQQELTLAAFATTGFWLIFRLPGPSMLMAVAVACGGLLATKLSGAPLAAGLAALASWQSFRRRELSVIAVFEASAAGLAVGIPAYVWCYKLTGNPVFPLFNGTFKSPLAPIDNSLDPRWTGHLTWTFLYDLFANTNRFFETPQQGASDVSLLVLAPAAILIGLVQGSFLVRAAVILMLFHELQILSNMQYLRYMFPGLPLLAIATGNAMNVFATSKSSWRRLSVATAATATVGFNLAVMNNLDWSTLNNNVWSIATNPDVRTTYIASAAPQRLLAKEANLLLGPKDKILVLGSDAGADFAVPAIIVTPWWSPDSGNALARVNGPVDAVRYLRKFQITHVFAGTFKSHVFEESMMSLVRRFGRPLLSAYGYTLYDVSRFRYGKEEDIAAFFAEGENTSSNGRADIIAAGGSVDEKTHWSTHGTPQEVPEEQAVRVDVANFLHSKPFRIATGYRYEFELVARCDRDSTLLTNVGFGGDAGWVGSDYRILPCSNRYETFRFPLQVPLNATDGGFDLANRPGESSVTAQSASIMAFHD